MAFKSGRETKRTVPFALTDSEVSIINKYGIGKNESQKLAYILHEFNGQKEVLVEYVEGKPELQVPDAVFFYEKNDNEGTTEWGKLPFPYDKKHGPEGIIEAAVKAGYVCQNYKENGIRALWGVKRHKTCAECHATIRDLLGMEK